ncbi:MAG: N-(5'-phosphoribosyl)anthranilate isomerase [Sulfuricurvum sp. PC08-66]|nr:MAG: N-(5'-phosphoribosyl)anthranilate isomerase [Sulfuricurvum sp. PC08-66]
MRVKICGITTLEDAMQAINAGADALGFVFYPASPRYITPETARDIINKLPPFVEKVGLFVDETPQRINEMAKASHITLAQLHFATDSAFRTQIDISTLPVVRVQSKADLMHLPLEYTLVDAYVESYGGAGVQLDLSWFEGIDCSRIILAGGLTPQNVEHVKPYGFFGVDVSSGVELSKGKKSHAKVTQFIANAKA